jgi:hypothetical protein
VSFKSSDTVSYVVEKYLEILSVSSVYKFKISTTCIADVISKILIVKLIFLFLQIEFFYMKKELTLKIKIAVLIVFTLIGGNVFPQTAVNSGLSFLKVGFGARNIALGDAGVISANNVTAAAYNPALLTSETNPQIAFSHSSWMQDVRSEMLAAQFNLFSLPIAVAINNTVINDIELRNKPGEAIATFNVNYFAASVSSAIEVMQNVSVGATAKFLYQGFYSDQATGWAFDFGGVYKNIIPNLNISLAARNIGSMNELRNKATTLPSLVSAGAGYQLPIKMENFDASIYTASTKYLDESKIHFSAGTEVGFKKLIFVRLGYQSGFEARTYSLGLGFNWRGINFDYAFAPFDYSLGNSHIISLKYSF